MTTATRQESQTDKSCNPCNPDEKPKDGLGEWILFAILLVPSVLIFWNSRALTLDFIDRMNAGGSNPGVVLLALIPLIGLVTLAFISMRREWFLTMLTSTVFTWFGMIYFMACIVPSDYDGEYNRYTRAMEPLPQQYDDLAAAKSLPSVATLISRASTDGRINRGEAYDILHSETYYAAISEKRKMEQDETRRKVLSR